MQIFSSLAKVRIFRWIFSIRFLFVHKNCVINQLCLWSIFAGVQVGSGARWYLTGASVMLAHSWTGFLPSGGPAGSRRGFGALGRFQSGVKRSGWVPPASSCVAPGARPSQLLWITPGLGGVQLHVLHTLSWMWVSGSGSERWGVFCMAALRGRIFSLSPKKKNKKKTPPLNFGSSQLTSCSKMPFDSPTLVQMERHAERKRLPVHFWWLLW